MIVVDTNVIASLLLPTSTSATTAPGQYADIDLLKAREEHLPGEADAIILFNAEIGQIKVILHPDFAFPPKKKFG